MSSPARKSDSPPHVRMARARLTPEQIAAREEILEMMRRHNPEPTDEELEAVRREWLED